MICVGLKENRAAVRVEDEHVAGGCVGRAALDEPSPRSDPEIVFWSGRDFR